MTAWPDVDHAAGAMTASIYRLHDYNGGSTTWRTRWAKIETAKGSYNWGTLDGAVDRLVADGKQVLFTVFGTPAWASARPAEASAYGVGNEGIAAEPAAVQDLADFCTTLASRYAGRITHYEIWNEANEPGFFSGTVAKLVEMVRVASSAIQAADPSAVIVAPSVTRLWPNGTGRSYMRSMYTTSDGAGGALSDWVDIASVHLYTLTLARVGEVQAMIKAVRDIMLDVGVSSKPLWNTEHTIISPTFPGATAEQRGSAVQKLLLCSAASLAGGVDASFIYAPDSSTYGMSADDVAAYNAMAASISGGITDVRIAPDGRLSYAAVGVVSFVP